jgi:hypothetical protein
LKVDPAITAMPIEGTAGKAVNTEKLTGKLKENFRPAARPRMKGGVVLRAGLPLGADNRPRVEKQTLENRPRRLLAAEMPAQAVHVLFAALA